jgi:hypothetical protein
MTEVVLCYVLAMRLLVWPQLCSVDYDDEDDDDDDHMKLGSPSTDIQETNKKECAEVRATDPYCSSSDRNKYLYGASTLFR